jgi:iron-sulfur cluster repair protein YtfE (RIC family)
MESILATIKAEHEIIREALSLTAESKIDLKRELYQTARDLLIYHMMSEEVSIYRKLETEDVNTAALIHKLYEEHQEVKEDLQRLNLLRCEDPHWQIFLYQLMEKVEDHSMKEEEDLFFEAKEDYSRSELVDMASDFHQGKHTNRHLIPTSI